jgi:AcrR family transcriptional regulator
MKDRITEASIELFNEMGTHRVTTNHIIDKLGISPGTFYYHFKNKEEIVSRIFDRITLEFDELFIVDNPAAGMEYFVSEIRKIYQLYYKYRFFYYDISMLLDRDEGLALRYKENYRLKIVRIRELTLTLEKKGILKKFSSDSERDLYVENQWIINDYWMTFQKAIGSFDENEVVDRGVMSYLAYLKPYLSDKARVELERFIM